MRVLVFDDEPSIGRLVVKVATMLGMDPFAVTDAGAFGHRLETDRPQLILLDLQLGETDGIEQLRRLAERQYTGTLVLMSGFDSRVLATARTLALTHGLKVAGLLEKPLHLEELERILERVKSSGESPTAERLREAIANDEMSLEFHPFVTRSPKVLQKLEALIRWDHPVAGRISPGVFLPVAERDRGTIDMLTDWVLGAVVDAYKVLGELGISVPLAVKMSTQNLYDLSLPDRIEKRLRVGGMPTRHLYIEITETAAFEDAPPTMDILSRLRLKGIELSIDDFGSGYSSLKLLQQMPFSEIKIDRSFVISLSSSRVSRAIVKLIVGLAANMEMACVAEGVDTEEAAELLEQFGVTTLQGYLITKPMPIEAVPAWLGIWAQSSTRTLRVQPPTPALEPAGLFKTPPAGAAGRLPPRQLEVMQLSAEGCSVKEIARRLNLGIGTVKVHLSLAYSALGARNRIDAIRKAGPGLLSHPSETAIKT